MPNILFLGVGKHQVRAIQYARELDLGVIGLDGNPEAAGLKLCDKSDIVNINDPDLVEAVVLRLNKQHGIDGVMAPAVEVGPSVGRVVDVLGLRGINERTARMMTDKILRGNALKDANIPAPKFADSYNKLLWNTFPAVIKPRRGSAAVGVKYIKSAAELKAAGDFDLIQEYIDGWQISTEVLVLPDGGPLCINADRNYEGKHLPFLPENGCQLPSKIDGRIDSKISSIVCRLCASWKLRSCAIKLDLVVKDNIVYVLEAAPRLGGGRLSSHMIPMALSIDWWKIAIKLAMGIDIEKEDFVCRWHKIVAQRYKFAEVVKSNRDRIADEIATGDTYAEAIEAAQARLRENTSGH